MNQSQKVSLGLALALGIIHYMGEGLKIPEGVKHYRLISFAAGVSIGYLFLDLLHHNFKVAHSVTFFLYYYLVGCVLVELTQTSIQEGTLFVFPVMFHAGLSAASLSEVHGHFSKNTKERSLLH